MEDPNLKIAKFLYEVGTLRKIPRMHRQAFLTNDDSDNIASHSFRVPLIAWMIAEGEGFDPYKTAMMALMHDLGETRTGDHNWIAKRYVKIEEDQIIEEQLGPFPSLIKIAKEYRERISPEAIAAKDADLIDQILLMREYAHQGNTEAARWLTTERSCKRVEALKLATSKKIAEAILQTNVYDWWSSLYTNVNK
jgi:putative hydrolase of HD superfamily